MMKSTSSSVAAAKRSGTGGGAAARTNETFCSRTEKTTNMKTTKRKGCDLKTLIERGTCFDLVPIGCSTSVAGRSLVLRREIPGFANPHHCGSAFYRWLLPGPADESITGGTCDPAVGINR